MIHLLFCVSLIVTIVQIIKEKCEPVIPVGNWANKDLYDDDVLKGVSVEQRMKNLQNGKYKLTETYPEPHRNEKGQIIIENCKLYHEDLGKYSASQIEKWIKQGRYNLSPEEFEKEKERIKANFYK